MQLTILTNIDTYSREEWGQTVADDYIASIDLAIRHLADNPQLLQTKNDVSQAFFLYPVREHYLVCSVVDASIYLLAVKHGRIDLFNRLAELEPLLLDEAVFLHDRFKNSLKQKK